MRQFLLCLFILFCNSWAAQGNDNFIILQSTTSAQNSGLYDAILPIFTSETGINVRVIAVGSGQALRQAADCNGEIVIVHDPQAERAFVKAGFAAQRFELMHNDYVIIGPADDPANIALSDQPAEAFSRIAAMQFPFVSRGDQSGTHRREKEIWTVQPTGSWYRETGAGMGATLNIAVGMNAYTLTDRASWMKFGNKQRHQIQLEGHQTFLNQYSIMIVNKTRCPGLNLTGAQIFLDWMLSATGQKAIGAFVIEGRQAFKPSLLK